MFISRRLAPSLVAGLAVIDIAPVRYTLADGTDWRLTEAMVRNLAQLRIDSIHSKREADSLLARHVLDPQLRAFALLNLSEEQIAANDVRGAKRLRWRIGLHEIEDQLDTIAGAEVGAVPSPGRDSVRVSPYRGPTKFVKASMSEYIKYTEEIKEVVGNTHWQRMRSYFPQASIETIDGAGHWVHVTRPEALHASIGEFTRDVSCIYN